MIFNSVKVCPRCGGTNPDDVNYCIQCGYNLDEPIIFFPLVANYLYEPRSLALTRGKVIISRSPAVKSYNRLLLVINILLSVIALLILFVPIFIYHQVLQGATALVFVIFIMTALFGIARKYSNEEKFFKALSEIPHPVEFLNQLPPLQRAVEYSNIHRIYIAKKSGLLREGIEVYFNVFVLGSYERKKGDRSFLFVDQDYSQTILLIFVTLEQFLNFLEGVGLKDKVKVVDDIVVLPSPPPPPQ